MRTVLLLSTCLIALPAAAQTAGGGDDTATAGRPRATADANATAGTTGNPSTRADLDTIVVTAPRLATTARAEQRISNTIINVQSIETILQYPDFNAAEALGRIPGVSLSSDTGEGRFVNIRGLDANLNGATFGGVVLLNTNPGGTINGTGRAVEFDTIPVGIVDRLVVRKTRSPDQEAEGLGGSIEISPRSAAAIKDNFVEGIIGGGYESLRDSFDPLRLEGTVGGRVALSGFDNPKPLAFVFTGSYNSDKRAVDDIEPAYIDDAGAPPGSIFSPTGKAYSSVDFRRYNYYRRRFAYGGDISFTPNDRNSFYLRASVAGYVERVNRQVLTPSLGVEPAFPGDPAATTFDPATGIYSTPGSTASLSLRDEQEQHRNTVIAFGGQHTLGDAIKLDYTLAYSRAVFFQNYDLGSSFSSPAVFNSSYTNTNFHGDYPSFNFGGFSPDNTDQWAFTGLRNSLERARDREYSGAFNLTVPVPLGDEGAIKFGGKARIRNKYDTLDNINYGVPDGYTLTDLRGSAGPYIFYGGHYDVGVTPDARKIENLFYGNPALFPATVNTLRNLGGSYDDDENVYSGYAQYQGTFGRLNVLAGLRIENTDANYGSNQINTSLPDANGNTVTTVTPVNRRKNYTDFFPTLQLRYTITPELIARATYSTAVGRPGFNQATASTQINFGTPSISAGNPNLKATTDNAFDGSLEYYLPNNGIASIGLFDKEFKNYIVNNSSFGAIVVDGVNYGNGFTTTYVNARYAYARGLEFGYSQRFAKLPAPFDGLGLEGNATLVESGLRQPGQTNFSLLTATSRVTWNASAFYEAHGVTARLAAEYVSASVFGNNLDPRLIVYQDKRLTLDATTAYTVYKGVQLYFNARNLLNTPLRYYEGDGNRPIQREFYNVTLETGVRFHF